MNKTKHTPGPWKIQQEEKGSSIRSEDSRLLGAIAKCHDQDAHLIAAAPDLLEALQLLLSDDINILTSAQKQGRVIKALNAIAKAKGEL